MNEQSRQKCFSEEVTFQSSMVTCVALCKQSQYLGDWARRLLRVQGQLGSILVRTCFREVLEREGRMVGSVSRLWQITENTLDLTKEYVVIS